MCRVLKLLWSQCWPSLLLDTICLFSPANVKLCTIFFKVYNGWLLLEYHIQVLQLSPYQKTFRQLLICRRKWVRKVPVNYLIAGILKEWRIEKLLLWRAGCRQSEQGELAEQTALAEHRAERKGEIV